MSSHWYHWIAPLPFYFLAWKCWGIFELGKSNYYRLVVCTIIASSLALLFTILFGQFTKTFTASLWLGAALASISAIILYKLDHRRPQGNWDVQRSPGLLINFFWGSLSSMVIAIVVWKFSFHDQMLSQGHPAIMESILRENFPPHLMEFPNIPLKYHYGSDLFGAILSYSSSLPGYLAVKLTQILGWIATVAGIYLFCRSIGIGRWFCLLASIWLLFGAGWLYLLTPFIDPAAKRFFVNFLWPDGYTIFQRKLNPGLIHNFFQPTYSLGLPVFFAYLYLLNRWLQNRSKMLLLAFCAFLLGALSIIQAPLYLTLTLSTLLVLTAQFWFEKSSFKVVAKEILLFSMISFTLPWILGGFFTRSTDYQANTVMFFWFPGYLSHYIWPKKDALTFMQSLIWYFSQFGSLVLFTVPAWVFAIIRLKKSYQPWILFFLSYSLIGFFTPQFARYRLSWDILKWFNDFHLGIILLMILLCSGLIRGKKLLLVLLPIVALDLVSPVCFIVNLAFYDRTDFHDGRANWWDTVISRPSPDLQRLTELLKTSAWNEMSLSPDQTAGQVARYSGQAQATVDKNTIAFGIRPELLAERNSLIRRITQDFDVSLLKTSQIGWLIYPCSNFEESFSSASKNSLLTASQSGKLQNLSFRIDDACWKVYHLANP